MTRSLVEENIDISLGRMGVDTLDLLQFHWWEYRDTGYLDALTYLAQLRDEGKIRHLALTNFEHGVTRQRIVEHGIRVVSNQVQYSLIDLRPEVRMVRILPGEGHPPPGLRDRLRRPPVGEVTWGSPSRGAETCPPPA